MSFMELGKSQDKVFEYEQKKEFKYRTDENKNYFCFHKKKKKPPHTHTRIQIPKFLSRFFWNLAQAQPKESQFKPIVQKIQGAAYRQVYWISQFY